MTRRPLDDLRRLGLLAGCAVLLAAGGPGTGSAAAQQLARTSSDTGVGELWKQYPLEDGGALSGSRGSKPKPGKPGKAGGSPSKSAPTASASPRPQPTAQAPRKPAADKSGGSWLGPLSIAALVVVLLIVDVLVFLCVRRARERRRESAYPVWGHSSNVYAEGSTERDGIGPFRGFVYAAAPGAGPDGDRMLCVHDPLRDEPIWVRRSEVSSLRSDETSKPVDIGSAVPTAVPPASAVAASRH